MQKNTAYVRVPLPPEMYEQLRSLAEKTGRSTSGYVRQVLRRFLDARGDIIEPRACFEKDFLE